jgi:hypothetical protein
MRTFLSIDLDYFNRHLKSIDPFFKQLIRKKCYWSICCEHQQMLTDILTFGPDKIINIDAHSDLYYEKEDSNQLGCGNWPKFIPNPEKISWEWRYSKPNLTNEDRIYLNDKFKEVKTKKGLHGVLDQEIFAIGICCSFSDDYTSEEVLPRIRPWFEKIQRHDPPICRTGIDYSGHLSRCANCPLEEEEDNGL